MTQKFIAQIFENPDENIILRTLKLTFHVDAKSMQKEADPDMKSSFLGGVFCWVGFLGVGGMRGSRHTKTIGFCTPQNISYLIINCLVHFTILDLDSINPPQHVKAVD